MCILANEAHLANTKIFTCVSGANAARRPTRQFTIYQNSVTVTNTDVKENFMCLPVPLQSGLIPKEHIFLYDFNQEDKGDLHGEYHRFFKTLENLYDTHFKDFISLSADSLEDVSVKRQKLEVVKVGNYKCSLAASPDDVLNLDEAVFGKPVGLREVLERDYATDFAFLICSFSQSSQQSFDAHPIAYSHPVADDDGRLFIPTKHYHGGNPNHKYVDDWKHEIFIFNSNLDDVVARVETNQNKNHATFTKVRQRISTALGETSIPRVLENAFKQHDGKDSLTQQFTNDKKSGCHVTINGRFDNIDLQPRFKLKV